MRDIQAIFKRLVISDREPQIKQSFFQHSTGAKNKCNLLIGVIFINSFIILLCGLLVNICYVKFSLFRELLNKKCDFMIPLIFLKLLAFCRFCKVYVNL